MSCLDEESHYAARGRAAIENDACFSWLFSDQCASQRGILMELGRIGQPEAIRHVAEHICELKPRTQDAVAMIQQWRTGRRQESRESEFTQSR